jgi:hypothetical protein
MAMTRPALILLFLLAIVPPMSFAQDPSLGTCPCTLKGLVLNSITGQPVRNALVESNIGSPNSTLTDSDGAFHFDGLPSGFATLSAVKPGFLPSTPIFAPSPSFRIAPDALPAVLKLIPGGVVRGHIVDDRGLPLENFTVQLFRRIPGISAPARQSFFTIVTNDLGNFRIPDLPAGSYYLLVAPQDAQPYRFSENENPMGYPRIYYPGVLDLSAATPIKVSAGRESVANLSLAPKPFVQLSGKVSGYPSDSSVRLFLGLRGDSDAEKMVKLDSRTGLFQTDWIPPGMHIIQAVAEGNSQSPAAPFTAHLSVLATSSMSGLSIVLLPGVNVPVNVEGWARKEDLSQLIVQLSAQDTGIIQNADPVTKDSDINLLNLPSAGMYFLTLPQGTYHLDVSSASDDQYFVESARSGSTDLLTNDLVIDSSPHPIEIALRRGAATLSGTVNLKDAARGAVVCLFPEKSNAKPLFAIAGSNGSFRFDNLPPGDYRVAALDSLADADFSTPASLKKISSAGANISLSPSQALALSLNLVAVEE